MRSFVRGRRVRVGLHSSPNKHHFPGYLSLQICAQNSSGPLGFSAKFLFRIISAYLASAFMNGSHGPSGWINDDRETAMEFSRGCQRGKSLKTCEVRMTRARRDGLYLVILGALVFVIMGFALEKAVAVSTADFRVVYFSARCLLEHHDPYSQTDLQETYRTDGGETSKDTPIIRLTETQYIYFPTAFPFTVPFALLPFSLARVLWLIVLAASLILGAFLMWNVGANYAPILSGILVGLSLATSELFLVVGNPGGIAIGLSVIAVWCFIEDRWIPAGIVCFSMSLMLKPHVSGLLWLYFLLAGGTYRRRALQTLSVVALCSAVSVLWISYVAPHWMSGLIANLLANGAHGALSDPGPKSLAGHGIGMMINLQTVFSAFRDDPRFYNPLSYITFAVPFLAWIIKTLRTKESAVAAWFALAPISALSMLPVYHRLFDAKIFLVAIPACAMIWAKGGAVAWLASVLSVAEALLTGGFPWAIFLALMKHFHGWDHWSNPMLVMGMQMFPVPITLLLVGIFFLWAYLWKMPGEPTTVRTGPSRPLSAES